MNTYKGAEQMWKAFAEGKKLTANPNHYCRYYEMQYYDVKYHDHVFIQKFEPIEYYYMNPQMNRLFAKLENGKEVDTCFDMWDLNVTTFYDYDELEEEKEKNEVIEMTVSEIQEKLGYKIKIVEEKNAK